MKKHNKTNEGTVEDREIDIKINLYNDTLLNQSTAQIRTFSLFFRFIKGSIVANVI